MNFFGAREDNFYVLHFVSAIEDYIVSISRNDESNCLKKFGFYGEKLQMVRKLPSDRQLNGSQSVQGLAKRKSHLMDDDWIMKMSKQSYDISQMEYGQAAYIESFEAAVDGVLEKRNA